MIRICDLSFKENAILTKEMLTQMNQEPKWLFLADNFRDIKNGIISGFQFINNTIDDYSLLTKGNLLIDGKWYRMEEDFIFSSEELEIISGTFYSIIFKKTSVGIYEIRVLEDSAVSGEDIRVAKFKYEYDTHKRVFRVPCKLEDFGMKNALLHDIAIPYYNQYGVAVCPPHIANCIKNSLAEKKRRNHKEETIFQILLNEKNISIASILNLLDMAGNDVLISKDIINGLQKEIASEYGEYEMSHVMMNAGISQTNQDSKNNHTGKRKLNKGVF